MSEYILTTSNLTKNFGEHRAVNDLNIHIKQGAIYGFIGRNGAGKTTTLKMLSSLSTPTSGEITLFNHSGSDMKKVRDRVGCLIENPGLYPDMSAYENVKIKCLANGLYKKSYVEELLDIVGLANTNKKSTQHFSLGMKQRLGIALALVGEPDLLILDEPTNGLDPQGIVEVRNTLSKLNAERNITIIASSHILGELSKIATDYGIIHNGELIQEFTSDELKELSVDKIVIRMDAPQNAVPVLESLGITKYKVVDEDYIHIYERTEDSALINTELIVAGNAVSEIVVKCDDLEQYYMTLTGGAKDD